MKTDDPLRNAHDVRLTSEEVVLLQAAALEAAKSSRQYGLTAHAAKYDRIVQNLEQILKK